MDKNNVVKSLTDFIREDLAGNKDPGLLGPNEDLLDDSLIDSLGIMRLIAFIEEHFGFAVPSEDVVIENFLTINTIADYLLPNLPENVD